MGFQNSDYAIIAREIFAPQTTVDDVPYIIAKHAKNSHDKGAYFYIELMKSLTWSKNYRTKVSNQHGCIQISSTIGGELLHLNLDATEYEPLAIVGPKGYVVKEIMVQLRKLENEYRMYEIGPNLEMYINNLKKDKIEIIWSQSSHSSDTSRFYFRHITSSLKLGSKVKKGEVIIFIEYFNFTAITLSYFDRYSRAASYCREMVNKLKIPSSGSSMKKETKAKTILKIWDEEYSAYYHKAIDFLKKTHSINENDYPFITLKEGKYYWHKLVSQKYLAGFIFVCMEKGFIEDSYTSPELMSICKNTFNNTT